MSRPPTERMVVALEVPADVTVEEVRRVLVEGVRASRVEAYTPAPMAARVCSPHGRADVQWVDGAWRCPACLIERSAPEGGGRA